MPKANLPTPDDINGQRNFSTPFTDLTAQARPISQFQADTVRDVGGAPQDNSLSQLGSALTRFNPALQQVVGAISEEINARDVAKAKADFSASRKSLAAAVEGGHIPAGYSRAYRDAYNATELETRAMEYQVEARKAYDEANLKDTDDTGKVMEVLGAKRASWRNAVLMDDNGKMKYSALDLAHSKFDDQLAHAENSLLAQHNQYRAVEREKQGEQVSLTNMGRKIDMMWGNNSPKEIAAALKATMFDEVKGIGANGSTKTRGLELITEALVAKATEYGDPSVMHDIAAELETATGGRLSGIGKTKEAFLQAERSIYSYQAQLENWEETRATRAAEKAVGLTPMVKAQSSKDSIDRATERYDRELAEVDKNKLTANLKTQSQYHESYILEVAEHGNPFNGGKTKQAWNWLRQNDQAMYRSLTDWLTHRQQLKANFIDSPESKLLEAKLASDMTLNPQGFDGASVYALAAKGKINPASVNPLLDDLRHIQANMEHPFLKQRAFELLESDIVSGVKGDDKTDPVGAGERVTTARGKLHGLAYEWLKLHPNALGDAKMAGQFQSDMRSYVDSILQQSAPEFAADRRAVKARTSTANVPAEDNRTGWQSVMPKVLGGKDAPTKKVQVGPAPLTIPDVVKQMRPADTDLLERLMKDPTVNDDQIDTVLNILATPIFKGNGRDEVEFEKFRKDMIANRHLKKK